MATIIDGRAAAATVVEEVKRATGALAAAGRKPGLAVIIVGNDPASHAYVTAKSRMAKECGFHSVQFTLPAETSQEDLANVILQLNGDPSIDGILVQLPLPRHLKSEPVIQSIDPNKDVDGLNVVNAGKIATGDLDSGLIPCTPAGAMTLVRQLHGSDLSGLQAVVIGRSNLFGKPMAALLLASNATVTTAHSRTRDIESVTRSADIVVAAVGSARMVRADWIKQGATIIDVGINRIVDENGKSRLVGDVDYEGCSKVAAAITPVPGGVGPMTIAMLMANTVRAARLRR